MNARKWLSVLLALPILQAGTIIGMDMIPLELRSYYASNQNEIDQLKRTTLDGTKDLVDRQEALSTLTAKYNHVVFPLAIELLNLENTDLDLAAINLVANNAVMKDHMAGFKEGYEPSKSQQMMLKHHETAMEVIRQAILSENPRVREVAASLASSLSDRRGLDKIREGIEKNLYSTSDALSYFGNSKPEVGTMFVSEFLNSSDKTTRAAATYVAARYPELEQQVLAAAVSRETPEAVRKAAVLGLSPNPAYATSLLSIALDDGSSQSLAAAAAKAYAEGVSARSDNSEVSRLEAKGAIEALRNKEKIDPKVFLPAIKTLERVTIHMKN